MRHVACALLTTIQPSTVNDPVLTSSFVSFEVDPLCRATTMPRPAESIPCCGIAAIASGEAAFDAKRNTRISPSKRFCAFESKPMRSGCALSITLGATTSTKTQLDAKRSRADGCTRATPTSSNALHASTLVVVAHAALMMMSAVRSAFADTMLDESRR